ncbi:MAG: MATE family efflux transporter [Clostridia bacterium]|nr:MATE family efflux transporter [Clostridia bacterium]
MTQQEKLVYMTETPVARLIPRLAVPTVISMLVTSLYNLADTFFVGMLDSTAATGAVGIVFYYMAIIQAVAFMFGHGSGNYISRALGAKDEKSARAMASGGFYYALAVSAVMMALGYLFLEPLARILGSTETILPYTVEYLRWILLGTPFIVGSFVLNNQLRFQGNAAYAMVGIISGAVVNIVLDPVCMFALDLGLEGAAIATSVGQAVGFFVLLLARRRAGALPQALSALRFRWWMLREIVRGGIPSLLRQGLASVSGIFLNFVAGGLGGDAAIAAMGIVSRVMLVANSALIGFGQGMQPVVGFAYGAKLYGRVREAFRFCVRYAAVMLVCIGAVGFAVADPLCRLFQSDPEVVAIARGALRFQCVSFIGNAWIIPANMLLQSVGHALSASVLAVSRQGLMLMLPLVVLSSLFGIPGLQLAQPVADVLTLLLAIPLTLRFFQSLPGKD